MIKSQRVYACKAFPLIASNCTIHRKYPITQVHNIACRCKACYPSARTLLSRRCPGNPLMRAKKALTDRGIRALKSAPAGKRQLIWDAQVPGLGVRVTDTGAKTFVLV